MPPQQRYTHVPGMGPPVTGETSQLQYVDGGSVSAQGAMLGSEDEIGNCYEGQVPAAYRLSSCSDSPSRPISTASVTAPLILHRSSDLSYKDLPTAPITMGYQTAQSSLTHQNAPSEAYWPVSDDKGYVTMTAKRGRRGLLMIAGISFGVLAVIGIVAGVIVVRKDKSADKSGSSANSTGTQSNSGDPSDFTKDTRLYQSFWGFAYTPNDAQPPWCGATQVNVTRDIQILSQLTTRLRLYGAGCNETALVLQAIQDTKVNMTIWPAIYVDSNETAYNEQLSAVQDALKTYGTDNIEGVIVGNEYILDTAGSATTTSSAYSSAVSAILSKVSAVKSTIQGMNLDKTLPTGTSDAGSILSTSLASGIDFFMANVHPYFGALPIDQAAAWTYEFFQEFDVDIAAQASNKPQTYIAETGWPTGSLNASGASDGAGSPQGDASVANLQTFLDTFVCQANSNGTQYFYFEAFDEPWKAQYGGVEPFWGLFDSDRKLKNITIPSCS